MTGAHARSLVPLQLSEQALRQPERAALHDPRSARHDASDLWEHPLVCNAPPATEEELDVERWRAARYWLHAEIAGK